MDLKASEKENANERKYTPMAAKYVG